MTQPTQNNRQPRISLLGRFPLIAKIFGGFIVVIGIVILSFLVVLIQLKPLVSSDKTEFRGLHISQDLGKTIGAEVEIAGRFFRERQHNHLRTFELLSDRFDSGLDSLRGLTTRQDISLTIDAVAQLHREYRQHVETVGQNVLSGNSFTHDTLKGRSLTDSIQIRLSDIREQYLSPAIRSLRSLDQQTETALATVYIILGLLLVVVTILAYLIARALVKPITALKAGTEKVGEGKYETVPVTTKDEVADLTRAFNLMSTKLRQLDEMRMQLMSEISHEMRTPLQVIKAGCYSIVHAKDGGALSPKQRDAVGMIHQATNRINQFVNSFLDVAKMEAGLMKFNFEPANITEFLTPMVQEAQLIAQTRQINLKYECSEVPTVPIDKERMSQVISNLLSNALKYTPDNGNITIRVQKAINCAPISNNGHGCIQIDVQDSGVGIPEADVGKLFQKFYQAKNTPLVNEKGSGLGLALVKHVTEAHGGRVSVTSKMGEGSTFSVLLPASS